jgi:hypothetical protein
VTFEDAVDELYGAPLEDFVTVRKRLAKELGGDEGKELAKLRKPNVAAWTLNQLARNERRDVDLLLDAGHRMRQAGAEKQAFEQARAKEADALRRLTKAAEALGASPQVVTKVNAALRAAAVTAGGREQLALGRFVDLPTMSGFEAYEGLELPKRAPATRAKAAKAKPRQAEERREAAAALREAEKQLHAAEREAERADKAVRAAQAAVDAAQRRVDQLHR